MYAIRSYYDCQVGLRGYTASRILQQKGFKVRNLTGGYKTYQMANYKPGGVTTPPAGEQANKVKLQQERIAAEGQIASTAEPMIQATAELDACGLCCPGPLVQLRMKMDELSSGEILHVTATDAGFYEDRNNFV